MSERIAGSAIVVENLVQRFRVIHERPDTVRELFSRFFRKEYNYHDFDAVHNVSFRVPKGQVLGIIGRNGSGKSTLLKIIAGVYRPTLGRVEVCGQVAPLIELGAGMHGELTGRENILLNGLMMGYSKKQMLEREQKIIEFAEIGDFIDVPVKQYSSGMYMRLAFSVATEIDPDILVIDEILAVGDAPFQDKCFDRLARFRESGKTILLVSHSLDQIEKVCDRCLVMDRGRLSFDGRPAEAIAVYKGEPLLTTAHELASSPA
ncbi:MAG TPA: ABC transporter ATP-binding protein [Bryobacteraceae bacterium]|jgi:ABC-type polysaccharide/polyol phosphate transport system ATPase subunit|nr:ABC transporter ATP-binding protein [Bryobacteraceae bacterium]